MKILLLHQFFRTPEEGGAINSYIRAKALVDRGHSVTVITTRGERKFRIANADGIEVHYLPVAYDNRFGYYARGWAFLKYVWKAALLARKIPDAERCYAISAPLTVGLIALWVRFRHGIPYLFEVGDLWPDAPVQLGYIRNPLMRKFFYALERRVYRKAEAIVALSPPIRDAIEKRMPGKKVFMIPNMSDCDFFEPKPKSQPLERKYGVQGKFVVSYLGAMGAANGLESVLSCASACQSQELNIKFLLCGDGAKLEVLKEIARKHQLGNVEFIPFANRAMIGEIMNITDAVFVSYARFPILETGSPNKFFDGLAAGKLIIVNFGGWIRNEIEESRCGIYTDPSTPQKFPDSIQPFMTDPARLQQYQQAARRLAENKYSKRILGENFVRLFA